MTSKSTPWIMAAAALALAACSPSNKSTSADVVAPTPPRLTLADLPAPYNEANLANGETAFTNCRNCHTLPMGAPNLMGPNLHGVFQRAPGAKPDFAYSKAMVAFSQATALKQWPPEEIDKWLTNPMTYLPGSAMTFTGLTDPNTRRDLIAWLMIQTTE